MLLGILCSFPSLNAQQTDQATIHFNHNSYRLTGQAKSRLDKVVESARNKEGIRVEIAGHTDSDGEEDYNRFLSKRRAIVVQEFLLAGGIDVERINISYFGENRPLNSNESAEDKQMNRRAEISITSKKAAGPAIFSMFRKDPQRFRFPANRDIYIEGKEGTVIEIPANSLVGKDGLPVTGDIEISLLEYYKKSDIILANLHTMSDTFLLETAGMINIEARSGGEELKLREWSDMFVTNGRDSIPEEMDIFLGEEEEGRVDWRQQGGIPEYMGAGIAVPIGFDGNIDSAYMLLELSRRSNEDSLWAHSNIESRRSSNISSRRRRVIRMGWVNWDRLLKYTQSTGLLLQLENRKPQTSTRLVFRELEVIVAPYGTNQNITTFRNLPVGQEVTLMTIGLDGEQLYYAEKQFTIERGMKVNLELLPVNSNELEQSLGELDQ